MKTINSRTAQYDIDDIFLKRSSPRAMSGEPVSHEQLMTLFEAARWAPSSGNNQPWRFLYAVQGTSHFETFFSFLAGGNQAWCNHAGALIIGLSKKTMADGRPNPTHSLDTGSAWENFALQGSVMGLVIHGMAGYDADALRATLHIPDDYQIELMIAVGHPGPVENLPEAFREREAPSQRKPIEEIAFEGVLT